MIDRKRKKAASTRFVHIILQSGTGRLVAGFTHKRKCQKALQTLRQDENHEYVLLSLPFNEARESRWNT